MQTTSKYKIHKRAVALVIALILSINPIVAKTDIATLKATYRNIKVTYNNKVQQVNREPYIVDGSVYMSIRDIANIFGISITWDATTNTVILGNNNITNQQAFENQVLDLVNEERAKVGAPPLEMSKELRSIARLKSTDMQQNNYFSHTSPTYGTPFEMLDQFNITYQSAAENIARGQQTPENVVNAWMNSPGHRSNILNANFRGIGIGVDLNGYYWTQIFTG